MVRSVCSQSVRGPDGDENAMKRSTTMIVTPHIGSLPRPRDVVSLLIEAQERQGITRIAAERPQGTSVSKASWVKTSFPARVALGGSALAKILAIMARAALSRFMGAPKTRTPLSPRQRQTPDGRS